MQTSISGDRITRVWIHFTVEALPRLAVTPEAYRSLADSRRLAVPEGWSEGTPALLAAAERTDRVVDGDSTDASRRTLVVAVATLGASIGFFAVRMRWRSSPHHAGRNTSGALLENLRKAHSVAHTRP